jgi:hypothetical protein
MMARRDRPRHTVRPRHRPSAAASPHPHHADHCRRGRAADSVHHQRRPTNVPRRAHPAHYDAAPPRACSAAPASTTASRARCWDGPTTPPPRTAAERPHRHAHHRRPYAVTRRAPAGRDDAHTSPDNATPLILPRLYTRSRGGFTATVTAHRPGQARYPRRPTRIFLHQQHLRRHRGTARPSPRLVTTAPCSQTATTTRHCGGRGGGGRPPAPTALPSSVPTHHRPPPDTPRPSAPDTPHSWTACPLARPADQQLPSQLRGARPTRSPYGTPSFSITIPRSTLPSRGTWAAPTPPPPDVLTPRSHARCLTGTRTHVPRDRRRRARLPGRAAVVGARRPRPGPTRATSPRLPRTPEPHTAFPGRHRRLSLHTRTHGCLPRRGRRTTRPARAPFTAHLPDGTARRESVV